MLTVLCVHREERGPSLQAGGQPGSGGPLGAPGRVGSAAVLSLTPPGPSIYLSLDSICHCHICNLNKDFVLNSVLPVFL